MLNRKAFSSMYLTFGVLCCLSSDIRKGRRAFLKAIKLYPFEIRHYFNLALSLLGTNGFRKIKEMKSGV